MTERVKRSLKDLVEERDKTGLATSVIYWGDNFKILEKLPSNSIDLIYLDPPFSPDRKYWDIWGENDYGRDEVLLQAYEEACKGGRHTYVAWMRGRVELMHRVLKETGSLYFHCDPQLGHYFKVMLDEIFGYNNSISEIVWNYGTPSGGRTAGKRPVKSHEYLYVFAKNYGAHVYNKIFLPYSRKYIEERFVYVDEEGRRYRTRKRNGKITRQYLDESPGVPLSSVWSDIKQIYSQHLVKRKKEERGYATQKPEALLERIIRVSSNEGDVVLDPFCGCGTTPAVAHRLGRKWIGIDIAEKGCRTTKERLEELGAPYCIVPWDLNERQLRELENLSGNEFKDWVVLRIHGIPRRGIDGGIDLYTSELKPVQVKKTKTKVGPGILRDFRTALRNEGKRRGYIISFYGFTSGAIEEANKYRENGIDIELVRVEEIPKYFD